MRYSPITGMLGMLGMLGILALSGACETAPVSLPEGNGVCDAPALQVELPARIGETSGVAASRAHPGVFWTHNDSGGDPVVFAVDSTGALLGTVRLPDAANRDWEDIAVGPCVPGGEDCLWVAEIGDNNERHPHVAVYRVPEPDPATDTTSDAVEIFRFVYPGGPRDAEAIFVSDAGVHIVSKGRSGAIELFRLVPPYESGDPVELRLVQRLGPPPTSVSAQVTAAAVDPAGQRVVIRTYAGLRFFETDGDTLRLVGRPADIVAPTQLQGEGVDFVTDQRFVLTSEAQGQRPATLALVTCDPLNPPPDTTTDPS